MKNRLIEESNFKYYVDRVIENEKVNAQPKFSKFLEMARTMAVSSKFDTYKIGATVTLKGRAISTGCNSYKTHPKQKFYNKQRTNFDEEAKHFTHAEIAALNKLKGIDLKDAELYVYRTGTDEKPKMSRPCAACMKAIKDRGIKVIHYTTSEGIATEYLSKDILTDVKKAKYPI
jgi:deoxycytidylate deaminase